MENSIFSVKGNTALITGASSGIGRFCAETLAKNGANVILIGRDEARLKATEKNCQQHGVKTLVISADIKNNADVSSMIKQAKQQFKSVDTVINAAGIASRVPLLETSEKQWDDVFDTNVKGTFLVAKACADWMISTKTAGNIINVSSSAAFSTTKPRIAYSASKIAVESATRTMALNLVEHNIRVNCIAPGFFITSMTETYLTTDDGKSDIKKVPMQRAASLDEMEGVLMLLASSASSYMTGSIIRIDGGFAINKV